MSVWSVTGSSMCYIGAIVRVLSATSVSIRRGGLVFCFAFFLCLEQASTDSVRAFWKNANPIERTENECRTGYAQYRYSAFCVMYNKIEWDRVVDGGGKLYTWPTHGRSATAIAIFGRESRIGNLCMYFIWDIV